MLRTDWQTLTIGEIGRVVTGGTPSSKHPELFGEQYPFITPTDIDGSSRTIQTDRFLSEEGRGDQSSRMLPPSTICFVCIGATIGKICMTDRPSFTNQQINSVIVDRQRHDSLFVYYLLGTKAESVKSIAGGAATPIVNKSSFSSLELCLPTLSTQHRIAAILSAYDDLIENNLRRIKILEEMAQSLYREWFVKFGFPGHEKVRMVDSSMGKIPAGWSIVPLAQVANVNMRSIRQLDGPKRIRYVDISSVSPGRIEKTEEVDFIDAPSRARRVVRHGDTIWSSVRPNRRSYALVLAPSPNLIVSTGFAVLSPTIVPYTFLYQAVTTEGFVGYLTNHATGAAYPAVSAGDFETAELLFPPTPLLDRFHSIVESIETTIHNLKCKIPILRETRDLLLPKLISGEVDVSELGIAVPEEAEA